MPFNLENSVQQALNERLRQLQTAQAAGQKIIGYFCCYVPSELIAAQGCLPLRLMRGGSERATAAGYAYTSPHACPFAAGCLGMRELKEDPFYQLPDYLADAPVCLQVKRMLENWQRYFGTPLIQIDFPLKFYEVEAAHRYLDGLQKFSRQLEEISGQPFDQAALAERIALSNQVRGYFNEFYELLKQERPPFLWRDLFSVVQASYLLDDQETLKILQIWRENLGTLPSSRRRERVLLIGGMLAHHDEKLNRVMRELDSDFIMDDMCVGSRTAGGLIDSPTLAGLAGKYLGNVPCASLPYPDQKTDPRLSHLKRTLQDYRIRGVIYYTLRFCDAYSFKVKEIRAFLEPLGVKMLHLHTDYGTADMGQLRTRVEAFLESLAP